MKVVRSLQSELAQFETKFTDDILAMSAALSPLLENRDTEALEEGLRSLMSSRRKLSMFLKRTVRDLDSADIPARQMRATRWHLNASKRMLRHWGRFETVILAQMNAVRLPLSGVEVPPRREVRVMDHVIAMFLEAMHRVANPTAHEQEDEASDYGCHSDIPFPMTSFAQLIQTAHRICLAQQKERPFRFLDVGSGGGTKVLAATTCFDECVGLEYEKSTVETGTRLLDLLAPESCRLIHGDALKFDGYADYDVIYFYRPMAKFNLLTEMEDRIISQATPGTLIVAAGGLYTSDLAEKGVHEVDYQVYVTGLSEPEVATLRETAELMGSMVPGYGRRDYRIGYWAPLFDVSARNGYFA